MVKNKSIRVMAMIYPIERHVGHWACSSDSIDLRRIIIEGDDIEKVIYKTVNEFHPEAIAIIGKRSKEYNDLLDRISCRAPFLKKIPRIYRCQNTVLAQQINVKNPSKELLGKMSHWFAFACDERFSLILVQTLTDIDLIRESLSPRMVVACPYGYDPEIFNPNLPELERKTDVGCYFSLKNDVRRYKLVEIAEEICRRRGWTFRFVTGKYWHDYTSLIRTTKVCLHHSMQGEIPFRIYETSCFGTVFVSDPLGCGIENLFEIGKDYLVYQPDLSDLELILENILVDQKKWDSISRNSKAKTRNYSWPHIAEKYVLPALKELLGA